MRTLYTEKLPVKNAVLENFAVDREDQLQSARYALRDELLHTDES